MKPAATDAATMALSWVLMPPSAAARMGAWFVPTVTDTVSVFFNTVELLPS